MKMSELQSAPALPIDPLVEEQPEMSLDACAGLVAALHYALLLGGGGLVPC